MTTYIVFITEHGVEWHRMHVANAYAKFGSAELLRLLTCGQCSFVVEGEDS